MKKAVLIPCTRAHLFISCFMMLSYISVSAQDKADTLVAFNKNGKWGFVARNVTSVTFRIEPAYEAVYPFYEGRAAIMKNGLWGFIDATGRQIIACEYDIVKGYRFTKGLVAVKRGTTYGVIDKNG